MEVDREKTTDIDEIQSEAEDEVTFLLRLRPTPSPPTRRRRHSVDCRPISQGKDQVNWDVIIQRRDVSPPPPIPPRALPSAPPPPPEEAFQTKFYPQQPPYYQYNYSEKLNPEFSVSFPNLNFIETNRYAPPYVNNCMPLPPKPNYIQNGHNYFSKYIPYNGEMKSVTNYQYGQQNNSQVYEEVFNVDENCFVNSQGCDLLCRPVHSPIVDRPKHYARPPVSPPLPRPPKPAPRLSIGVQTNPYIVSSPLGRTNHSEDATDTRVSVFLACFIFWYIAIFFPADIK